MSPQMPTEPGPPTRTLGDRWPHVRAHVLIATAFAAVLVLGVMLLPGRAELLGGGRRALTPVERKRIVYSRYKGATWPKLGEPKPGEWLALFDEPGRTYEEYVEAAGGLKSDTRTTIYLQPFGPLDDKSAAVLKQMAEFTSIFFDCKVSVRQPVALPAGAYVKARKQYDAIAILDRMARHVPADARAYVGVTTADLYSGKLAFVFGLGRMSGRVAVYSLHRYGAPGTPEFRRRSLKIIAHETGHAFGITHCIFYRCCMNGSNSLVESDAQPLQYCPLCHDKLRHVLGFDARTRFERLAAFYKKRGFDEDARIARARMARHVAAGKE